MSATSRIPVPAAVLLGHFRAHARQSPAAAVVASRPAAFEGWLHAEVCAVLYRMGFKADELRVNAGKARERIDILADGRRGRVGIEVKCFQSRSYSPELKSFPTQLDRLRALVDGGELDQAIGFASFYGFPETRLRRLVNQLRLESWAVEQPQPILVRLPKQVGVYSYTAKSRAPRAEVNS